MLWRGQTLDRVLQQPWPIHENQDDLKVANNSTIQSGNFELGNE